MTLSFRRWAAILAVSFSILAAPALGLDASTQIHERGRCAIRGHCGKQGFLGRDLPCPDNGLAEDPGAELRKKIVSVCGDKWAKGPVCCNEEQVDALQENLKKAETFIASCPACESNFFNLFCSFTCSPDQSLFVNVTKVEPKGNKFLVTELDNLWSDAYGSGFYDSCKDVKFGATNSKAMGFIGGGAKNYTQLLKFLGQKSLLGSPFQINFPRPSEPHFADMRPLEETAHPCNSTDPRYKCACMDCESSCAALPEVNEEKACHVGSLPCLSFAVIVIYSVFVLMLASAITGSVAWRKHTQNKNQRLRLLQDTTLHDDEDEEADILYQSGMQSRPTRKYWLNTLCNHAFHRLGRTCAQFPAITIVTSLVVVGFLSLGWLRFDIELKPERLWVAPNSDAAQEKAFFDNNFGPFFRAEQAFVVNDTQHGKPGPVLSQLTLGWWFDVERRVKALKSPEGVGWEDVCYNPTGEGCVLQSVSGYFQQSTDLDEWQSQIEGCVENPSAVELGCLPDFGLPLNPKLLFAPYNDSVLETSALVATWVVKNHAEGTEGEKRAIAFERVMIDLMKEVQIEARDQGLRLSFNTEVSLELELNQSSNTDANIVIISYIIMFLYASIALGSTALSAKSIMRNPMNGLVQSKFMLGIIGIIIVLLSVSASVGLFSACGIKVTLIIAEVIPFLVLAVGVDNIFLIVHEFERANISFPNTPVHERMAQALGRMGPSILLSATMETVAFGLGTVVGMPAVRNFAAYAAGAVFINAILQITMFVAALALNQRRVEDGRIDCIPCVRVRRQAIALGDDNYAPEEDALQRFIRQHYAPALLGKKTKTGIVTIFLGLFTAGIALLPSVQLGLDQRIALPSGSYMIDYFNDLYVFFNAGPPVYFVTRELNVTERAHQQQLCGRFSGCHEYSLTSILEQERKRPEVSYIADPAASWVDDFFLWLNPDLGESCCVDPHTGNACFAHRDPPWNITLYGMPEGQEYMSYAERWLAAPTNEECALGGAAAYSDAVVLAPDRLTVSASHFRSSHTPLRSQEDFINSYASARRIARSIETNNPRVSVFPYSKHYIFFDQYSGLVHLTIALLGSAVVVCFAVSTLLLGSVRTGAVVSITVVMTLVDIGGAMALWGVYLNALTLVNLVICVGIAVEFCAHIARAFQFPSARLLSRASSQQGSDSLFARSNNKINRGAASADGHTASAAYVPWKPLRGRDARAWAALTHVGGSVFSGITITKLLGVTVLAFTRSKIFEVYYFRVWLSLVVLAALHALVFLPVALSLAGGLEGWVDGEGEGAGMGRGGGGGTGLEEDLAGRRRWRRDVDDDPYRDEEEEWVGREGDE